ncbi:MULTISPECIES: hypothetical protein [unclassified Polaribacter]|uniref:hypothetical protein n=1 Tax=unclassified Polaribacter TaxID=196858 RepID=UPI0011BF47C2|nr:MULTISPECIES: hypothetical protein [unclassified Polaribacter]TXD52614.1 hypothetical protein ES043_08005 [Polaribacter sp. IC063]TXD61824.1 hypothetical protein ES044_03645 [Polaribacter sp. IC066]
MNPPSHNALNVDSLTSMRADVGLTELITAFEKKYTEIKLESCDYTYNLKDKNYKCKKSKKLVKKFKHEFVETYRDTSLFNKIIKSKKTKILVIYGASHYYGLFVEFYASKKNKISKI